VFFYVKRGDDNGGAGSGDSGKGCGKRGNRQAISEDPYRELPPKVAQDYMARTEEILRNAKRTLAEYEADPDYKYIRAHRYDYTEKKQIKLLIRNVLGYVTWLKEAISEGDYVTMRQHEQSEWHIDSFKNLADTMRETPAEDVQISLFDAADIDLPADQEEEYSEDESIGISL
jgi:hypothetical protein